MAVEEEHLDVFETEMKNLEKFGDNYLALQAIARSNQAGKPDASE